MRVTCNRLNLLSACKPVNAALPKRPLNPVLDNVRIVARDGRCTLTTTDMEVGISLGVEGVQVMGPGQALFPAKQLTDILKEIGDKDVTVRADSGVGVVSGQHVKFEVPSGDPTAFPDLPTPDEGRYHEVNAGGLREMIRRTVFATADQAARYSMTGVLWEIDGDTAKLVATDGRRLAVADGPAVPVGGHTTKGTTSVVPAKAMAVLDKVLTDAWETVRVCFRADEVFFVTGRGTIYSRLVQGRFPDYKGVLPKTSSGRAELDLPPFRVAVKQAAVMTGRENRRVTFRFGADKLTMFPEGLASGKSTIDLPIRYAGKATDITLNPDYVVEMLKVLPPELPLTLDLIDGKSPALFRAGDRYLYLVMPLS